MHVVRLFGTNDRREVLPDVWADMARIDEITIKTQDALHFQREKFTNQYQEVTIKLNWHDADGEDGEEDSESRETKITKLCSPDETDPANPLEWVPVRTITKVHLTEGNVVTTRRFLNLFSAKNRKVVENRRFYHYDTSIDSLAQAAADSGQRAYFCSTGDYELDEGTRDEGQYLEHEVPMKFGGLASSHWLESNGDDLETTFKMKNDYLLDFSDPAKLAETGADGHNPPWRFDPFQNLINSSFGGLAVEFLDGVQ